MRRERKRQAGGDGFADVWRRGYFAWEYKGKRKDLGAAYTQLLQYREALDNPPLLVVCDLDRFEVHTNFMKSPEFEQLPPEVQQGFVMHFQLTQQALAAEAPTDPKLAPKISFNARATTSAEVMAKALNKAGIQVTEEEVAAEPLETAVYDSMDKPDADSAGNDPLTAQEQQMYEASIAAEKARGESARADKLEKDASNADELHREKNKQMRKPRPTGG